ncbi:MAG: pyruvate dehydrogenase (acetyl-transferring), homodimeric type [Bryobacteraceae bacterium]|nr:pyruvate dehydrogenase (acetyl-transferring), homodimeric type [Bryobacteraceae bacterium]
MLKQTRVASEDLDPLETSEWLESLDEVIDEGGPDRASYILQRLNQRAAEFGVTAPLRLNTPYVNTIPKDEEVAYPGNRELERRIKNFVRWNALAMVVRANKYDDNIGGHISTYASLATLVEVGQNWFFHGSHGDQPGDLVYYQGHASPGMYSRAYVEGRLSEEHLLNFRHELRDHPGLSSYPHPWLMPEFWQFPTVSMGLGPINAIYQARFMRYLENRGIIAKTPRKIWAFLGDGETDEPESLGALTLASREHLDNLVFVVNCNLQRLDGPVRGNGKIVNELEGAFRGAGWNVIKCLWGSNWDALFARDSTGLLIRRMEECVDGEYQNFKAKGGKYVRENFFGKYPELLELVKDFSDDDLSELRRGGHDPLKVYNAYVKAANSIGAPTVILAKTVKGYGLGEGGEGRNATHQQKKLTNPQVQYFYTRFGMSFPEEKVEKLEFARPAEDSDEMKYLRERQQAMGGSLPARVVKPLNFQAPDLGIFSESIHGSGARAASTTSAFVGVLKALLKDERIHKYIVPIIPDEARTFGMDSLFSQIGIYASQGQLYTPVDKDMVMYYKEAQDGQILEEGITEAGSMASFTAAGTSYANYGVPMIPFFIYYSMFGFQRIGDLVWAFADSRGKGFMIGGTAGRTTLLGEGLQHQDGQSPLLFSVVPTCKIYDPAFAYEIAVIVQDGIRRMYQDMEDCFYYLTVSNENYAHPEIPATEGVKEGILRGIYKFKPSVIGPAVVNLFGSGSILNEALRAQQLLAEKFNIAADVWSVTSYVELRREALETERWNRLHPDQPLRVPHIQQVMESSPGPIVAASDYMKALPDLLSPWLKERLVSLGTDGFGRSDNRQHLRRFFENDGESIAAAALSKLARDGQFDPARAREAMTELGLDSEQRYAAIC